MPRIRIPRRLPFSRQYTAPEGQMYKLPEDRHIPSRPMLDDRRGYTIGSAGIENPRWEGKPLLPIQGPRLPDRVERARQRYLDALEEYQAEMERMKEEAMYNRSLPERAERLKKYYWDEDVLHHPDMTSGKLNQMLDDQIYDELDDRAKFW